MDSTSSQMDEAGSSVGASPCTPKWSKSLSRELEDVISRQNLLTSRTRRRVLTSLQETSKEEEDKEMGKLRNKAIEEIIVSECNYLRQLELIEEFFMNPIKEADFLPGNVFAAIFGDILGIRQVNKELLTAMEQSTDQIGKVFLELAPYLKFYSTYANDFESAIKQVEEWKEKHKGFRNLVANQETRPEVQTKLSSLLITPIQRIPRYKLLLDDIVKNTPRFHPDKNNLEEARTQIDAIAWYINDQIKDHDHNQLMINIQKSLVGGVPKIVKPGRKLIRHGNLMKMNKSGGHAQPRYFVLFTDMLMYCKIKGHTNMVGQSLDLPKNDCLEVCCVLPLKHTKVENVVGKGVFTVTCQKETLVLYTTNADESSWVEVIEQACSKLKKNRATLKRESNQFEPLRKPDIIKMRRESLSKIMLMRRTEAAKKEEMKEETRTKSPLRAFFSPKKRKHDHRMETPAKMTKIVESTDNKDDDGAIEDNVMNEDLEDTTASTALTPIINELKLRQSTRSRETGTTPLRETPPRKSPARKAKENQTPTRTTPSRKSKRAPSAPTSSKDDKKLQPVPSSSKISDKKSNSKKGTKTEFRKNPRNSVKSLSLHRAKQLKKDEAKHTTIFRSPSIYDEDREPVRNRNEDTMTTYLSGKIVPLTPSTRPTNVDHLVRRGDGVDAAHRGASKDSVDVGADALEHQQVDHPLALPDKKSFCIIS